MQGWEAIRHAIESATGDRLQTGAPASVGGGCINSAFTVNGASGRYFVKLNRAERLSMFEAEAEGLRLLGEPQAVRVPQPICHGTAGAQAYLVLEHIDFGRPVPGSEARLGEGLAAIHRQRADGHGWDRDNTIGSTPQINTPDSDWVRFYREHRLRYQLELAADNGAPGLRKHGERLLELLPAFFSDYQPPPSLLHGDLWGGNAAFDTRGAPVIFDPACYYGDRETDLAMTELFGGFGGEFYRAYEASWPLDPGYRERKSLYQLYHVLNHYNLFGGGYRNQAEGLIKQCLAVV